MNAGCLVLLVVLVGSFFGYRTLLHGTMYDGIWWVPALLAVGAAIIVGGCQGTLLALRKKSASTRPRSEWKDGGLVVVSGKIQAHGTPLIAPFSGTQAAIVQYAISLMDNSSKNPYNWLPYHGSMMAPCTIQTTEGSFTLVGFPSLSSISSGETSDDASNQRAAEFLRTTNFKVDTRKPFKPIDNDNQSLTPGDGSFVAHFADHKSSLIPIADLQPGAVRPEASLIVDRLLREDYSLEESVVKNGAQVTICGTYLESRKAIDITAGDNESAHSLDLGDATDVVNKNILRVLVGWIFFGAIVGYGNYYVLKHIGFIH